MLDQIDEKILRELAGDGRMTNTALADRVGLSPSACLRRVQELERRGVIAGYRAVLNPKALGIGVIAFVTVGLSNHSTQTQAAFERAMAVAAQVTECHNITGAVEYLLRVEATDLDAYKHFHLEVLGAQPNVISIVTHIVLDTSKDLRGLPKAPAAGQS
ncbi:MAG: Lrp/AsnC family transcriptional regulator [Pseudomonadota bacterium]